MATRIVLTPNSEHCIETIAKRDFSKSVDAYMQSGIENRELEEKIKLLKWFLETMNFRELRKESEVYLLAGKSVRFVLYSDGGRLYYEMQVDN